MFEDFYKNKKVLITGHTGFKGTWLTCWLLELGANIVGVSDEIPTEPSMFVELGIKNKISHNFLDIRDFKKISNLISYEKPDIIFHLAAQAIVSESYHDPIKTVSTNVMGTINILESLKTVDHKIKCVLITSDKSYFNVEWPWGYKETDRLGGKDIYSGSKAAADILIEAIPGPSAVTTAVSLAGITGNQFTFLGFVPQKKGRETFFKSLTEHVQPVVAFESTHRIIKALQQLVEHQPTAMIYIGRELTKMHEEMLVGTAADLLQILTDTPVKQKGEFVMIVDSRS